MAANVIKAKITFFEISISIEYSSHLCSLAQFAAQSI
jgi:hypothetical protein